MLAGSITPRPRPPARSRRASSQVKSSPPPPYRPSLPDESPTPSEHEKLFAESLRDDWRFPFSAQSEQWNDRSREELSDLLHKADEIIKDRELELNMTSAVCKSLYENNRELKTRHQALLARLPTSPASSSPVESSTPSPMSSDSQLPQSPHYYSADEPHASANVSTLNPRPRPHYRRVSVSPADLALLSDQNTELLAKLEKLEGESIQADQAGRRKLRSLEKEIQGLRDELDKTRARSDELEKKARVFSESAASRDEEAEKRRRKKEERFRALRGKADDEDQETEVRDFAPGGALSSKNKFMPRRRHISEAVARPHRLDEDAIDERPRRVSLKTGLSRSASLSHHFRFPPSVQSPVTNTHEYALVSQLLLKIRELEETNTQITEQQAQTVTQLQMVQKDATSLRLVYESLGDGEGVEWITEEGEGSPSAGEDEANETIRFASLRRTLSAEGSIDFADGIDVDMRSSLKNPVCPDHVPVVAHSKVRRSVVGLFDSPREDLAFPMSPVAETTSVLDMMIPGLPPVPFVPQPSNTSTTTPPTRSPSPTLSSSLVGTVSSIVGDAVRRPTLDSELGAAFDGNWDAQAGLGGSPDNHHFRTSSIVSLTSIIHGADSTSSSASISGVHTRPEPESSVDALTPAMSLSQRNSHQIGFRQEAVHRSISNDSGPKSTKQRRKSQTIRMRAAHWQDGRFGGTLIPADTRSSLDISRPSTPVPERLANAFEAIVDTMSRGKGEISLSLDWQDDGRRPAEGSAVGMRSRSPPAPRQRGIVAFVLEIWLWLQFAIIVIVFVWAMARRGPKSVLEEAGRRKTG
ncbi:hypothetical protein L210DRAFT_3613176 [Boletus edulis BED1]|uniref:Uncharacterized protein n=1 Tax=Boletus edulis BED1 TaxID=1328754 RepID=A0AAD4GCB0_BOLED|nr:hypothetical protein L210DRAFT_3613176 [Boletus edulis BED1]